MKIREICETHKLCTKYYLHFLFLGGSKTLSDAARILGPFPPSQELPDSNKKVSNNEEEERGTHDAPNTDF